MSPDEIIHIVSTAVDYARSYPGDHLRFIVFGVNDATCSVPALACEHWPAKASEEPHTWVEIRR